MASTEELLAKFRKRDLTPPSSPQPAASEVLLSSGTGSQAEFRRLRRRGAADNDADDAATLEGLFDENDGLIGLGG